MKLTNNMRDSFVYAVMQDVPTVDYNEQFSKIAIAHCLGRLPKEIVKIYNNNSLRGYLHFDTVAARSGSYDSEVSASLPLYDTYHTVKAEINALPEVQKLSKAKQTQSELNYKLRKDLQAAIYSVSTLKAAIDLLPEFADYLPKPDDKPIKFAPAVIANLAANLTAAGWPKDKNTGKQK